jgi:hypothetical protein
MNRENPKTLWTLRRNGRWVECVVRLVPHGIEVEVLSDGSPLYSRVFPTGDEALAWAEEERGRSDALPDTAGRPNC